MNTSLKGKGVKGPTLQGLPRWEVDNSGGGVLGAGGATHLWVPVGEVSTIWLFTNTDLWYLPE